MELHLTRVSNKRGIMKRQQVYVFIGMLVISSAYTNCGQAGHIELKSIPVSENLSAGVVGTPTTTVPSKDPVQDTIMNCRNALANNKLMVLNQKINFEDSRVETRKDKICEFAPTDAPTANGNLSMRNEYMQARYEQNRKLDLPNGPVICDIQMKNDLQSFQYDDVFLFSFNGYILATNNKLAIDEKFMVAESRKLAANNFTDLYKYDWLKLRGAFFENKAHDYCAGATEDLAQCSWPVSQEQGAIKFSFSPSLLIAMSAGRASNNQVFSFAITGDNDPESDCYHEKLEFAMTVKYYIPSQSAAGTN